MKTGRISAACLIVSMLCIAGWSGCGERTPPGKPDRIEWTYSLDSALAAAKGGGKFIMVDFMATWCPPCRAMEDTTFCDSTVIALSRRFVTLRIDVDKQKDVADRYGANARKYGGIGIPNILFMTAGEEKLRHIVGFYGPGQLAAVMDSVLAVK